MISGNPQAVLVLLLVIAAVSLAAWGIVRHGRENTDREATENALKESNSKFRSLFENVLEGVYQSTPGGKLLTVNPALVRMFGHSSEEEFLRVNIVRDLYVDAEDRSKHLRYLEKTGELRNAELTLRRKDGSQLIVLENSRATRDQQGNLLYYEGTLTDITEHKRAQRRERERNSILELIARNDKLEDILRAVAGMVEGQFPKLMAAVDLLEGGRLFSVAAPSLPPGFAAAMDGLEAGEANASSGTAAHSGRQILTASIISDPLWAGWREIALRHEIRASSSAPILLSSGRVVGTLSFYSNQTGEPTREMLELMEQASQLAAIAIDRRQLNDQLIFQAQHDAVTRLPNRFLFTERLELSLSAAKDGKTGVALLYVDLDDFKMINDTWGHSAGDSLLCEVAARFLKCLRSTDTVARTGGDEFTAIISDLDFPEGAQEVAQKLLRALQSPFEIEGESLRISASIGISVFPDDGEEAETLQRHADRAMYRAKKGGKNAFERFSHSPKTSAGEADVNQTVVTEAIIRKLNKIEGALTRREQDGLLQ
ncbi:MAG: diguanylate cyclase [Acidobacteriota bacterium]|nr:diguanylate cyclase [Acidobacteriota bacterium]